MGTIFFYVVQFSAQRGPWPPHSRGFSRSHIMTRHSRQDSSGRVISSSQRPQPDNTQHSQQTNIHGPGGIRTHDRSRGAAVDLRLRPHGHWDRLLTTLLDTIIVSLHAELYRGANKFLALPTSRCILFDGENISLDTSLVIYIYIYIERERERERERKSTNISQIIIINSTYVYQNLLSLQLVSFLVGLRTYQHPCTCFTALQCFSRRVSRYLRLLSLCFRPPWLEYMVWYSLCAGCGIILPLLFTKKSIKICVSFRSKQSTPEQSVANINAITRRTISSIIVA